METVICFRYLVKTGLDLDVTIALYLTSKDITETDYLLINITIQLACNVF